MTTADKMPPLPTIVYGRVVDGIPVMTVAEHAQQMHAYARAYAAQEVAKEREACAAMCVPLGLIDVPTAYEAAAIRKCAAAIRARSA